METHPALSKLTFHLCPSTLVLSPKMKIWIINPFDELPGDTDVRHRYWSLAETLACPEPVEGAEKGHDVTWWSSDFSHRSKSRRDLGTKDEGRRTKVEGTDGNGSLVFCPSSLVHNPSSFVLRLIPTPPYQRNVSLARWRSHQAFARNFRKTALEEIESGKLPPPDRIIVSLPPLGTADAAFAIRKRHGGEVVLDIMDAWPETFYRVLPGFLGPLLLWPMQQTAVRACRLADRISAVSQVYIDLARSRAPDKPTHLCYHGIDLDEGLRTKDEGQRTKDEGSNSEPSLVFSPSSLVLTYIGSLERSYDLETAIMAIRYLEKDGFYPEFHIAGAGSQEAGLKELADKLWPEEAECPVHFHGLLDREGLQALLARSSIGLIPMRQDSHVGLPYKLADYCAAGLAVVFSLDGECRRLLETKKAGSFYNPANVLDLSAVLKTYLQKPPRVREEGANARRLAEELFDRSITYPQLAEFVVGD